MKTVPQLFCIFLVSLGVTLVLTTRGSSQDVKPLVVQGELTVKDPFDKIRKESWAKVHELELKAGAIYLIELKSGDFDTFLRLEDAAGKSISENDDISDADLNSRLGFAPLKTGTYRVIVTTFVGGKTGKYTLQLGTLKKIGEPKVIDGKITPKSAKTKSGRSSQLHKQEFKADEFWLIDMVSKDFEPFLIVGDGSGKELARDIDRARARLVMGFSESGQYGLQALAFQPGTYGDYSLRLQQLERSHATVVAKSVQPEASEPAKENPWPLFLLADQKFKLTAELGANSAKKYQIEGDVGWEPGRVRLQPGATWTQPVQGGPVMELSLQGAYPQLLKNGDAAETWVAFIPQGVEDYGFTSIASGDPLVAVVRHIKTNDRLVGEIRIYKTSSLKNAIAKNVPGTLLRQYSWQPGDAKEPLLFRYQYGVLMVHLPGSGIALAHAENYAANIKAVIVHQRAGEMLCSGYQLEGQAEPKLPPFDQSLELLTAFLKDRQGNALKEAGRYREVVQLRRETFVICERILGKDHFYTQNGRNSLAVAHVALGEYAVAYPLLQQGVASGRQVLGEKHPSLAFRLTSLAAAYDVQGDFAKAEPLFKQATEIKRQVYGENSLNFASGLANLGNFYRGNGERAKASHFLQQAIRVYRERPGEAERDFAFCLDRLGTMYLGQGAYAKAEPLLTQALEIYRDRLGENHPEFATSLDHLATAYRFQGKYAKAEPVTRRALEIRRQALGEKHPNVAYSLASLSHVYEAQKEFTKAEPLSRQALQIMRENLEGSALVQSERQQLAYSMQAGSYLRDYLDVTSKLPGGAEATYDLVLSWNGAVTTRQRLMRVARTALDKDSVAKGLFTELDRLSRQIATVQSTSPDQLPKGTDLPRKLAELTLQREAVEVKLSERTEAYRRLRQSQKLTTVDLQKRLPDGAVLVEFVEYENKLAAFAVTKDRVDRVELGSARLLADAAARFRTTLKRPQPLAGKDDPALFLREKLLDPLDKHLAGAKLLLIAPAGPLCQLPFGALPSKDGKRFLLEDLVIANLPVPQMLPELLDRDAGASGASMLVLGDVDFDAAPGKPPANDNVSDTQRILAQVGERTGKKLHWQRLPGTIGEMEAIEKLFRGTAPKGAMTRLQAGQASKAAFRANAPTHAYLHLATHGYFAPEEIKKARLAGDTERLARDNVPLIGHHPGLLSGLALAGANRSGASDDGILTALEVGELDLSKVRLAVLSACETGLGETAGGEGVLGLQRAFQIAGAQTTVTTLWSIPDEPTRVLMERFYDNHWSKKMGKLDALIEAQQWMLREGRSHAGVQRGIQRLEKTPEPVTSGRLPPYYWAAFVLSGDWR